jgi:lysozyme family protein
MAGNMENNIDNRTDPKFQRAITATLAFEGGYANDPDDPGGETNFGITKRTYPHLDIRTLTRDQAADIYHRDWWLRYGYDRISDAALAAKLFDLAVNIGPQRAHALLQKAFNRTAATPLKVDGILGPASICAVNAHPDPAHLLAELKLLAVEYYLGLEKSKFLAGWVRRAIS